MTPEETQRAAQWAKMTKAQRKAHLRQMSGPLSTTSAERMKAVAQLKKAGN